MRLVGKPLRGMLTLSNMIGVVVVAQAAAFSPSGAVLRPLSQRLPSVPFSSSALRAPLRKVTVPQLRMSQDDENTPILFNANEGEPPSVTSSALLSCHISILATAGALAVADHLGCVQGGKRITTRLRMPWPREAISS